VTITLRARLALTSTAVVAVLLGGLGYVSYRVLARRLDADATVRLDELTRGLHGYLRFDAGAPSVRFDPNDSDQAAFVHEATRYYQVYDAISGTLLVESDGLAPLGVLLTAAEVRAARDDPSRIDLQTDYGRMRISSSVIPGASGRAYLLQVGVLLVQTDSALSRYRGLLLGGAVPALVLAALASWWLSGFALAPLGRMAAAARVIDVKALDQRLPTRGVRDELDTLAEAFNETLAHLEHTVGEMRQFSAALAHELRTPMAALRGEIDLALRGTGIDEAQRTAFASQIEEIDRLKRLIDQILTLARAEAGEIPLTLSPTDIGDLAASLVDQLEPVAEARGITLHCERPGAAVVSGDPAWLRRLLLNLIDNALKFTGEGGRVLVRVAQEADEVSIQVHDTGIGMPPEVARRAFERFFRADPARSSATEGAGLGLSLAQWIADRHHGAITVASKPGEGSTFTVTLPGAGKQAFPPA